MGTFRVSLGRGTSVEAGWVHVHLGEGVRRAWRRGVRVWCRSAKGSMCWDLRPQVGVSGPWATREVA
eukprot:scaffold47726_cov53-Phaeocystis_antarctica.AAC.3